MKKQDQSPHTGKSLKRKKGFFSISGVADMFSIHQQTIRLYEREGFINPKRSDGNTRLFSEEDVNKLEEIIYLTHKMGINLAGVQMILKLQNQIKKMQKNMNRLFDETNNDLKKEQELYQEQTKEAAKHLSSLQQKNQLPKMPINPAQQTTEHKQNPPRSDNDNAWEIDYDE